MDSARISPPGGHCPVIRGSHSCDATTISGLMPGQATTASGQNITGTPRNDLWQILLSFRLLGGVASRTALSADQSGHTGMQNQAQQLIPPPRNGGTCVRSNAFNAVLAETCAVFLDEAL